MRSLIFLCMGLILASCATTPEKLDRIALNDKAMNDPHEKINRKIHKFNSELDRYVMAPVTRTYRTVTPVAARRGVSNYYRNVKEMLNLPNALAQGKVKSAFRAADRLLINGVLGLGLADHATDFELFTEPHDFGQTMAVWGVPSGPYIVLPFLGPSTLRDGIGWTTDFMVDPMNPIERHFLSTPERLAELGLRVTDTRSRLMDGGEQILTGAADEYATMRSAWLQLRRYELFDGMPPIDDDDDDYEDYEEEPSLPDTPSDAPSDTAGEKAMESNAEDGQ